MIQRIQTLFLLATFGLLLSLFFVPMATTDNIPVPYTASIILLILLAATTAIAFFTVFLYRHRIVQVRLCTLNGLLLLVFQGLLVYYFFTGKADAVFSPTAVFPVVAIILTMLARRYIVRDEALVRASDRLR
jgi:hypothetical protein